MNANAQLKTTPGNGRDVNKWLGKKWGEWEKVHSDFRLCIFRAGGLSVPPAAMFDPGTQEVYPTRFVYRNGGRQASAGV